MNCKVKISVVVGYILLFAGCYISLDWSRIFLLSTHHSDFQDSFTIVKILKLLTSLSCAFLAWTTYSFGISKSDSRRIKIAFIAIICGDIAFTFRYGAIGVPAFALGQLLLCIRNSNGLKKYFKSGKFKDDKLYIFLSAVIVLIFDILLLTLIFYRNIGNTWVFLGFTLYSVALCCSVWIAWLTNIIGYFRKVNAILITIGMTCFFFCDFTVGYGILAKSPELKEILTSTTWIFYTPAVVLLALSSYDFSKISFFKLNK